MSAETKPEQQPENDAHEPARPPEKHGHHVLFHLALIVLLAIASAAVFVMWTGRKRAEAQEGDARQSELAQGPKVQVVPVSVSPPERRVTLSGEVHAFRQATLYAKISGYLRKIRVDKGDHVKEGEILGIIESPETEQDIASKKADVAIKKSTDERYKNLAKIGVISQQDKDVSAANVDISEAELSRVKALQGYELIRAPFSGVITARYADPGALLQAATSSQAALALVDVADMARVRIFVYPSQADAVFLHEGDPVVLTTDERPDRKTTATVTRLTRSLDPRTRTMLTEIDVDNTGDLFYPGTFVHAAIVAKAPPALSVPTDAIFFRHAKPVVAVIEDGRAKFVSVETGDTDGSSVRVTGVKAGDVVGLHVGDDVFDGGRVQAVAVPAPAGAGSASAAAASGSAAPPRASAK